MAHILVVPTALFLLAATSVLAADPPDTAVNQAATSADGVWTAVVDIDSKFSAWQGTRGTPTSSNGRGRGSQFYMPFGLSLSGTPDSDWKYEFQARSGYAFTKQETVSSAGSLNTLTDTILQSTLTYLSIDGFIPFISLNVNAPSGKSALYGKSRFVRMDPDLVDLANFGEGWNTGPTIGANIPISDELIFTIGAGYTARGEFPRETDDGSGSFMMSQKMNPGNNLSVNASVNYQIEPWSFAVGLSYTKESRTFIDGLANFRAGDKYIIIGSATRAWSEVWSTSLSGNATFAAKNDTIPFGGTSVIPELYNSNSRMIRFGLDHLWTEGNWSMGPSVSYLNRNKNSYNSINYSFIPAKTRLAAGGLAKYKFNDTMFLSTRIDRAWVQEKEYPLIFVPIVKSNAWFLSLGAALTL